MTTRSTPSNTLSFRTVPTRFRRALPSARDARWTRCSSDKQGVGIRRSLRRTRDGHAETLRASANALPKFGRRVSCPLVVALFAQSLQGLSVPLPVYHSPSSFPVYIFALSYGPPTSPHLRFASTLLSSYDCHLALQRCMCHRGFGHQLEQVGDFGMQQGS